MSSGPLDKGESKRTNRVATVGVFSAMSAVFLLNVVIGIDGGEIVCVERESFLPPLCTTTRELAVEGWRQPSIAVSLLVWAIAGVIGWRTWRRVHLGDEGPQEAFSQRGIEAVASVRRRMALVTFAVLAAVSFNMGTGVQDKQYETIGPVCTTSGSSTTCRTSTVVIEQTIVIWPGQSAVFEVAAWLLALATLCWWMYVIAAENLARRFGEENLWRTAMQMRRESAPQYPSEQQRGNRY